MLSTTLLAWVVRYLSDDLAHRAQRPGLGAVVDAVLGLHTTTSDSPPISGDGAAASMTPGSMRSQRGTGGTLRVTYGLRTSCC